MNFIAVLPSAVSHQHGAVRGAVGPAPHSEEGGEGGEMDAVIECQIV